MGKDLRLPSGAFNNMRGKTYTEKELKDIEDGYDLIQKGESVLSAREQVLNIIIWEKMLNRGVPYGQAKGSPNVIHITSEETEPEKVP